MSEQLDEKARKERSPSFPFISLDKAIERVGAMLAAHRRSPTRVTVAAETWNYSPASSGLVQTVAALKGYGLIDDVGRGEDRRIQVSDLAARLLTDERPGAREAACEDAALRPRLLAEHYHQWGFSRPSDAHCISELTLDRGFTSAAARAFLAIYDANLSFIRKTNSDKSEPSSRNALVPIVDGGNSAPPRGAAQDREPSIDQQGRGGGSDARAQSLPVATLPLPEGVVSLSVPQGLSPRSVKALRSWLDVIVNLSEDDPKPDVFS